MAVRARLPGDQQPGAGDPNIPGGIPPHLSQDLRSLPGGVREVCLSLRAAAGRVHPAAKTFPPPAPGRRILSRQPEERTTGTCAGRASAALWLLCRITYLSGASVNAIITLP